MKTAADSVTAIRTRPLPLLRQPAFRAAAAFVAIGAVVVSYLFLVQFHVQDRRPAQAIEADGIGRTFEVLNVFDEPDARITITGGTRQNERAGGGDRADRDNIVLQLTYVAVTAHSPDRFAWTMTAPGTEPNDAYMSVEAFGELTAGQVTAGSVLFSGVPSGQSATITFQGSFDDAPRFTMVVPPLRPEP